jgi:hypothetical protein
MKDVNDYKDILTEGHVILVKTESGFGGMKLDGRNVPIISAISSHNLEDKELAEGQMYSYSWIRYQPITLQSRQKKFNIICSDKTVTKERDLIHSTIEVFKFFRGFDLELTESVKQEDGSIHHTVIGKIGYGSGLKNISYSVIETEILHKL